MEEHLDRGGEEELGEDAIIVQPTCHCALLRLSSGIPVPTVSSSLFREKQIYVLG